MHDLLIVWKRRVRNVNIFFLTFKPTCASYLITILPQKHIIETMLHDHTLVYYVFTSCHIFFRSETFINAVLTLSSLDFAISLAFSYFGDTMLSQSAINLSKNLKCNAVCLKNENNKLWTVSKIHTAKLNFKAEQTQTSKK